MRDAPTHIRRFGRSEDGAVLVEYGIIMGLFLLLVFGLLDFGRLGFSYVMAQKATERAVRQAAVMTPVCTGLPSVNVRGILIGTTEDVAFGASCNMNEQLCADPGTLVCTADNGSDSANAIWAEIAPLMPNNATAANLQFRYSFDPNLGFLGGPYTPLVTTEIINLDFEFVTPLGGLAGLAGASGAQSLGADLPFPSMSASLPAENLGRL